MKTGQCPKCGSNDVRSNMNVPAVSGWHGSNKIPIEIGPAKGARLDNYVCANCGYVESYIAEAEDLQIINEKWPRVGLAELEGFEQ